MAQQLGAIRYKGKIANVVGFSNSASSKSNKNFVRERATQVANPQTYKQAKQRAKAKPAQMFYAAFENVLNHAFIPSGNASKNRNRFMKLAMTLPQVSDVVKDANYLPLCNYQVSEGALGVDTLCKGRANDNIGNQVIFNLFTSLQFDNEATIADVSTSILAKNPQLSEGQELTIIAVCGVQKEPIRFPATLSFVLDTSDSITTVADISGTIGINGDGSNLCVFASDGGNLDNVDVLAAALIISSKTKDTWRYTNSFMVLSLSGENSGLATESDVIKSYQSADATRTSDKILQQANNAKKEEISVQQVLVTSVALKNGVTGEISTNSPTEPNGCIAILSTGERRIVTVETHLAIGDGDAVAFYAQGELEPYNPLTLVNGSDEQLLTIDKTTWDGMQTIDASLCPLPTE